MFFSTCSLLNKHWKKEKWELLFVKFDVLISFILQCPTRVVLSACCLADFQSSTEKMFGMNSSGDSNSHQFWVAAAACMAAAAARTSVTNLSQGKLNPSRIKFWATFEKSVKQEMVQETALYPGQKFTFWSKSFQRPKWPKKCTKLLIPFSGTALIVLSLSIMHFVLSVSLRNRNRYIIIGWNSLTSSHKLPFQGL